MEATQARLVERALELARTFETDGTSELREIAGIIPNWQESRDLLLNVLQAIRESPGEEPGDEGVRHLAYTLVVYAFDPRTT